MEGRGGCCIARYAGGYAYAYDVSNVDRAMLKFRPIAPKSSTAGESASPPVESPAKTGRGKRKYTSKKGCCTTRKRKEEKRSEGTTGSSGSGSGSGSCVESETNIVTLPLLPETPVEHMPVSNTSDMCFPRNHAVNKSSADVRASTWLWRAVESWVTVECVTETWVEGRGLGSTDEEKRVNLERDTCPGFGSDGAGRVRWTNEAYRKMVGQGEEAEVLVWLATKGMVREMLMYLPAFTCRVRMQYLCGKDVRSLTVPCDAWRMTDGGFAWRLDVKAALTLCLGHTNPN